MYKVGDKVRIKRTNTIHEIESIIIGRYWNRYKLKGVCYSFLGGELESDKNELDLELILPNKPVRYEPKLKYVSIDNFKVGDIVEKDGFLFEILEIKLSKFKLKPLSKEFYIEASCKELNKPKEDYYYLQYGDIIKEGDEFTNNNGVNWNSGVNSIGQILTWNTPYRRKIKPKEHEFDFIATWQKEREFYLIESKGGSLSRMDKPEFEEYCEKMDRLNVKYRIIE